MIRAGLLAVAVGVLLRLLAFAAHEHPRGDVVLDVGVARSLADGQGFASGFERGTLLALEDAPAPPRDRADQHPPGWPLVGAALSWLTGSAFAGLKLASLLCGLALLAWVARLADRLVEAVPGVRDGWPALAAGLVGLSFLAVDFAGNGALYGAQAFGVLLLVDRLAAPRASPYRVGLLLGALWLLNHQNAVLLALPPALGVLAAPPGRRLRALGAGLRIAAVAVACQVPWWWRNALVMGQPFFSVNPFYFLVKAGVTPTLGVEDGWPVARFERGLDASLMLQAAPRWLAQNALYVFTTGLLLWPGMLGVLASGSLPLFLRARRDGDRLLLGCLLAAALLAAVSLLWPATKLRYLVTLVPLGVLLGVRLLAATPTRAERWLALLVAVGWAGLVLLTLDDLTGSAADPRPGRWWTLCAGGAGLMLLPLVLRHGDWVRPPLRVALCSGALFVPVVALVARFPPAGQPHTTYHSSVLTPDFFGRRSELGFERDARAVEVARADALARGARRVAGPMELLAEGKPTLVQWPLGAGSAAGDAALQALVEGGAVDHVLVLEGRGWPDGLLPGERWLKGLLRVVARWPGSPRSTGATLSKVER